MSATRKPIQGFAPQVTQTVRGRKPVGAYHWQRAMDALREISELRKAHLASELPRSASVAGPSTAGQSPAATRPTSAKRRAS